MLAETGQQIELEIEPAWQEIRGGRLSNIPAQDIEAAFLGVFDGIVPESTRFLDGETIGALFDRVLPAVARLARGHLVGHRAAGAAWRRESRDSVACA